MRSATDTTPNTPSAWQRTGREVLGGPTTYSDQYVDETSVVRIHSGNGPHEEMDQRAIACFDQALQDTGLVGEERLRRFHLTPSATYTYAHNLVRS